MMGRIDMGADESNPFKVEFVAVAKERIGRTVFEYECQAIVTNISPFTVENIQLELAAASDNVVVIQPNVMFGDAELGEEDSVVSIDTFTIAVDRSGAIELAKMIWHSTCRIAKTGEPTGVMASGRASMPLQTSSGDIVVDGSIDYLDMAGLANQWLGAGSQEGITADIAADGIVDFADFAELAEQWKK